MPVVGSGHMLRDVLDHHPGSRTWNCGRGQGSVVSRRRLPAARVPSVTATRPDEPETRPDLDRVLNAALAIGNENVDFDFKLTLDPDDPEHKLKLVRAIAAFTNTDRGGHLILGVDDNRTVVGVEDKVADKYDQTRIQRLASSYLSPSPALQVRQHVRNGLRVVLIEVSPFLEVPSIITRTEDVGGKSRVQAGTLLVRGQAAEATLCCSEADLRRLCDAIAVRRANAIVDMVRRGTRGAWPTEVPEPKLNSGLRVARELADPHWPSGQGGRPFFETFFSPVHRLMLPLDQLRSLFPRVVVPGEHGFPFWHGLGDIAQPAPEGWIGKIESPRPEPYFEALHGVVDAHASYLWLFCRDASFLDREGFWEDKAGSVIPGGFGIYHLVGRLILLVRLLDRVAVALELDESLGFSIGAWINNIRGRHLADELHPHRALGGSRGAQGDVVEVSTQVTLKSLREGRLDVTLNLAEEVAWKFGAADVSRQQLVGVYEMAARHLGAQHAFPPQERVA